MNRIERRRSIRIELHVLVNFDKDSTGKTKNISETGLCIITNKNYTKGNFLTIVFALPAKKEMKIIGNIAWTRKSESGDFEIGIETWHIEESDRKMIKEYIKEQINIGSENVIYEQSL